jgi:hypothetical protein
MKLFATLRSMLFPTATVADYSEPDAVNSEAKESAARARESAIELMKQWSPERVSDLERIANKNFVEVYLVPDQTDGKPS